MSIFKSLNFSPFLINLPLLALSPQGFYLSCLIPSQRNAAVAIIKVGLTAASESGGQKGNKTSEIRGQPPGAKVE